jgi:single-strand DNA-binding protein
MASYNKVMLLGNLTRDPEVRYTPKGSAVADLAIAVNRVYTAENGERREEVTYVDVTLWARTAEIAGQYLKKGSPVFIEGRLQMDTWEDKQTGQKRSKIKVVGEVMQLLGRRGDGGEEDQGGGGGGGGYSRPAARPAGAQQRAAQPSRQQQPPANEEFNEGPITDGMEEDDIPF